MLYQEILVKIGTQLDPFDIISDFCWQPIDEMKLDSNPHQKFFYAWELSKWVSCLAMLELHMVTELDLIELTHFKFAKNQR